MLKNITIMRLYKERMAIDIHIILGTDRKMSNIVDQKREKISSFLRDVGVNEEHVIDNTISDPRYMTFLCKISNVNWQFTFDVAGECLAFVNNDKVPIGVGALELDMIFDSPSDEYIKQSAKNFIEYGFKKIGKLSDVIDLVRFNLHRIPDFLSEDVIDLQIPRIIKIREQISNEIFEIGKRLRSK